MNRRFRYEQTPEGKIAVYVGDRYLTTCDNFTDIFRFIMNRESKSA